MEVVYFGSYVSFPTLFAYFLGFDIPTSSFTFIENVFYYSCTIKFWNALDIIVSTDIILVQMENSCLPFGMLEVTTPDMQTLLSCMSIQEDDTGNEYVGTDMTIVKELWDIADTIKNKMGAYQLFTSNCQHFCHNIFRWMSYETSNYCQ